jgi:hypothetical protein
VNAKIYKSYIGFSENGRYIVRNSWGEDIFLGEFVMSEQIAANILSDFLETEDVPYDLYRKFSKEVMLELLQKEEWNLSGETISQWRVNS